MAVYRVLVVDDSRFMRQVITDMVNADSAFSVLAAASDGEQAVQLALELQPDLIIMDLEMPRMNGLEALQRIMAVRPAPIIMMSAVTDNGTRDTIKALQYGAFDFVRKPDNALHLDIDEVCEYLLEKLHAAAASLDEGGFQVMPAVEERELAAASEPDVSAPGAEALDRIQPQPLQSGGRAEAGHDLPSDGGEGAAGNPPVTQKHPDIPDKRQASRPATAGSIGSVGSLKLPKQEARAEPGKKPAFKLPAMPPSPSRTKTPASPARPKPEARWDSFHRPAAPGEAGIPGAAAPQQPPGAQVAKGHTLRHSSEFQHIVAMGTSTGGPRALHEVLARLPKDFEAPVLVVQHMPPKFTHSLAQRLDTYCALKVREAVQGDLVETGNVYIAPGGWHMRLAREPDGKYRIKLSNEGPRNGHMPSVDVLFESLVGFHGLKRHAVLMTGMGSDGAAGMQKLQQDGSETRIAQSQETCVVYGMPGSAVRLGAANHVIPLQQIASVLVREIRAHSK